MSNLVIVAIPDENDRVWKVSSEKIPHLTLLFLGDVDNVSNVETIVQFVEHAANTTLSRFYLPVDRRDELGEDKADVLFFKKGRYDYKAIRDFRAQLLQEDNIRTAYDGAQQFDGPWQPHLTLGYPSDPAKPIPNDAYEGKFYDVSFNKIAVWMGDFDGPEFLLKDYWDEWDALETVPMDVAMSSIHGEPDTDEEIIARGVEFLTHYGVKGMKWGARKDPRTGLTEGETKREGIQRFLDPKGHALSTDVAKFAVGYLVPIVAPLTWPAQIRMVRGGARGIKKKALDNQEKKFAKNAMSPKNFAAIHNGAIGRANREIGKLDAKYPDLSKPATKKKYDDAVVKAMQDAYRESANSLVNKANTVHLDVSFHGPDGQDVRIHANQGPGTPVAERVKHADEDDLENAEITVEIEGKVKRNATGHVVGIVLDGFETDTAAHSVNLGATLVSAILNGESVEHYGIKGMRWGVRREGAVTTQTHLDTGLLRRRTKVEAKGGEAHDAHTDAVTAAVQKQKVKKSGTDALSTQELRELANRLQVENQVSILMSSKGKRFVQKELEGEGKNVLKKGARRAAPHVVKRASKGAATVATTAALL